MTQTTDRLIYVVTSFIAGMAVIGIALQFQSIRSVMFEEFIYDDGDHVEPANVHSGSTTNNVPRRQTSPRSVTVLNSSFFDEILQLPDDFSQTASLYNQLLHMDAGNVRLLLGTSESLTPVSRRTSFQEILFRRLAVLDPRQAIDVAET